MKKKTILIFGISSFVGSNLAEFLKKDFRIIGTYFSTPVQISGVLSLYCDILSRDSVQFLLYTFRPDITIYCVGLTKLEDCAKQEKFADALNAIGVFNVTTFSERYKSKFCYISSSYIFSGIQKTLVENDTPAPINQYGKTKAAAEFYIQKSCLNYLIFRCCILYGRSINPRKLNWFEAIQKKINYQESLQCDFRIFNGFLDVLYLGLVIKLCIEREVTNRLFHLCSTDIMTYYEFAKLYAKIFNENEAFIQKGNWTFPLIKTDFLEENPDGNRYFHLNIKNIESFLNIEIPSIKESIDFTFQRLNGEKSSGGTNKKSESGIKFI